MSNIVFWSGGQDSTLVALQLLRKDEHVELVSFDNCWIGGEHQQNLEKIQRNKMVEKMKKEFGGGKIETRVHTWDGLLFANMQSRLWASIYPLCCKDGDTAYFGAIRTDDFWHYKTEFVDIFNRVCSFNDTKVKLTFPLEWWNKKEIIRDLKKYKYYDLAIHSGDKL